ncbi:MAG: hypothetical protein KGZ30_03695 [Anaplasmataceae bacterium]|nr:hypothetical protein [Anaplasmataceae bacterium]
MKSFENIEERNIDPTENQVEEVEGEELDEFVDRAGEFVIEVQETTEVSSAEKKLAQSLREEGSVMDNILSKSPDGRRGWHKSFRGALAALSLFTALGASAGQAKGFEMPEEEGAPRPAVVLIENENGGPMSDEQLVVKAQEAAVQERLDPKEAAKQARVLRRLQRIEERRMRSGGGGRVQTPDDQAYGIFDKVWGEVEEFGKNARKAQRRVERQQRVWKQVFGKDRR